MSFTKQQHLEIFGCSEDTLKAHYSPEISGNIIVNSETGSEIKFHAVCILSDVQELISFGEEERARQLINRVKWMLTQASVLERKNS